MASGLIHRTVAHATRIISGIVPNSRSFLWATTQTRAVRRRIDTEGTDTRAAAPPVAGPRGWFGVRAGLAITRPTCLTRALVVQAWMGSYSTAPDVVIGVRNDDGSVHAHAWVDGADPWFDPAYEELTRLPS